jgi:hypothetical protein
MFRTFALFTGYFLCLFEAQCVGGLQLRYIFFLYWHRKKDWLPLLTECCHGYTHLLCTGQLCHWCTLLFARNNSVPCELYSLQSTQYGTGRVDSLLLGAQAWDIRRFFYTIQACIGRWLRDYTKNLYLVRPICFFSLWAVYMSIWC